MTKPQFGCRDLLWLLGAFGTVAMFVAGPIVALAAWDAYWLLLSLAAFLIFFTAACNLEAKAQQEARVRLKWNLEQNWPRR